jgi:hypothetical protein
LNAEVTLVPAPKSTPLVQNALWVPKRLCDALRGPGARCKRPSLRCQDDAGPEVGHGRPRTATGPRRPLRLDRGKPAGRALRPQGHHLLRAPQAARGGLPGRSRSVLCRCPDRQPRRGLNHPRPGRRGSNEQQLHRQP